MVEETKFNNQLVYENNDEIKIQNEGENQDLNVDLNEEEKMAIEGFRWTYNAKYIEDLSHEKKQYACGNNPILLKLVNNLSRPLTYISDYLEGPITFTKVTFENEWKTYYIFGELHIDTRGECLNIPTAIQFHEYIKKLSVETKAFFDFYFELPMVNNEINSNTVLDALFETENSNDIEHILIEKFKKQEKRLSIYDTEDFPLGKSYILNELSKLKCRDPVQKLDEDCSLIRIHDIDLRNNFKEGKFHDGLYGYIFNFITNVRFIIEILLQTGGDLSEYYMFQIQLLKKIIGPKLINFLERYIDDDIEVTIEKLFNYALLNPKVENELNLSYMKSKIKEFIKLRIKKELSKFPSYSQIFKKIINYFQTENPTENIKKELLDAHLITEDINVFIMDIYGLSRIFKMHYPRKNTVSFQPIESTNVIIYAGDNHSKTYAEFMEFIGGKVENIDLKGRSKRRIPKKDRRGKRYWEEIEHPSCVRTKKNIPDFNDIEARRIIEEEEKIQQGEIGCQIM